LDDTIEVVVALGTVIIGKAAADEPHIVVECMVTVKIGSIAD